MLHILLGSDDYSKKSHISLMLKQRGGDLEVFANADEIPEVSRLIEADLFSRPKTFVLPFPPLEGEGKGGVDFIDKLIASQNCIIISIDKIDKRKKENKELLANKSITVKEFVLPHGLELNKWIEKRVNEIGAVISKPAIDELAVRLGRDNAKETKIAGKVVATEEVYTLWQTESEIKKLIAHAAGRQIEMEDVRELVPENLEVDVFQIINAIGEGKKQ